jgi:hypothetical protein
MNPPHDRHLDEDQLADWILQGAAPPDEQDLAHLRDCALCRGRQEALRHLQTALEDLDLRGSSEPAHTVIPGRLTRQALRQRERRQTRAAALISLAAAAALAIAVPRLTAPERIIWTDPGVEQAVVARTMELLGALPSAVTDSLLAFSVVAAGKDPVFAKPVAAPLTRLSEDERSVLLRILQERTSNARGQYEPTERGGT